MYYREWSTNNCDIERIGCNELSLITLKLHAKVIDHELSFAHKMSLQPLLLITAALRLWISFRMTLTCLLSLKEMFEESHKIDMESEEFLSLPLEIQHELLIEMKETHRRRYHREKAVEMPEVGYIRFDKKLNILKCLCFSYLFLTFRFLQIMCYCKVLRVNM